MCTVSTFGCAQCHDTELAALRYIYVLARHLGACARVRARACVCAYTVHSSWVAIVRHALRGAAAVAQVRLLYLTR